jgi:hypothetical protein
MIRIIISSCVVTALIVAACTRTDTPDGIDPADGSVESPDGDPRPDEPASDPFASFDADRARAAASDLLGVSEAELEPSRDLRIARRGDERFPMTMDLRPGRMNVELDEREGTFVVTRVSVETPDGALVVE